MRRTATSASSVLALSFLASCASQPPPAAAPVDPDWRYDARFDPQHHLLEIEAHLPMGTRRLDLDRRAQPFVRELVYGHPGERRWRPGERLEDGWRVGCGEAPCIVRYRFALEAATTTLQGVLGSERSGDILATSPSLWLVRPGPTRAEGRWHLRVATPPGVRFVSGVPADEDGVYSAPQESLASAPYAAFGELEVRVVARSGGTLTLAYPRGALGLEETLLEGWVARGMDAVSSYYGRFPIPSALVLVLPSQGNAVAHAVTKGFGGAAIKAYLGPETSEVDLFDDWKLVHEMVHLALPNLEADQAWLEEGLATYVEPLARARAGFLGEASVWVELMDGVPFAVEQMGSAGLAEDQSWAATYWGGALFCLLADVEIRRATEGAKGLEDALIGILDEVGDIRIKAPVQAVLAAGDRATGTEVLTVLHAVLSESLKDVDLHGLWEELGVERVRSGVRFHEGAPLAELRQQLVGAPR